MTKILYNFTSFQRCRSTCNYSPIYICEWRSPCNVWLRTKDIESILSMHHYFHLDRILHLVGLIFHLNIQWTKTITIQMHWRSCYVTCFIRHYEANQYVLFSFVLHSGQQHFVLIKIKWNHFFLKNQQWNIFQRKQITWILHKNPHQSKRMTSAEGVTGRDRKPLNSQHASVDTTKNGDVKDRVLMDLVNGFVQEILRKGMAKYQEDIKSQREHNVTVGVPCFANCKEKTCKPPFFSLVCNKQPIRHAVYRVIFALVQLQMVSPSLEVAQMQLC